MARPGFYNDNAYRSYPFIDRPGLFEALAVALPDDAVVDASFIAGLDAEYDDAAHSVYLKQVQNIDGTLRFVFACTAPACANKDIVFNRDISSGDLDREWLTEYAESAEKNTACADEPVWSGFIVTGKLNNVLAAVNAAGGTLTFAANTYVIEPARIQNLNKSYLRSISVGNYARTTVPPCDATTPNTAAKEIIWNEECLKGALSFKEGYNASILQISRANTLVFSVTKGGGAKQDNELCENYGEIPFFAGEVANKPFIYNGTETKPALRSKFLSGGWSCKDLIFTINGVGGSNVNIIGGKNIQIGYDENESAITIALSENAQGRCNG